MKNPRNQIILALFTIGILISPIYGMESQDRENVVPNIEICDQNPDCPRDKHPVGENCPHSEPGPGY